MMKRVLTLAVGVRACDGPFPISLSIRTCGSPYGLPMIFLDLVTLPSDSGRYRYDRPWATGYPALLLLPGHSLQDAT